MDLTTHTIQQLTSKQQARVRGHDGIDDGAQVEVDSGQQRFFSNSARRDMVLVELRSFHASLAPIVEYTSFGRLVLF
jgi:hypothetical protein